jgi:hypothetical protein
MGMKITKRQLRRIIKEEKTKLHEQSRVSSEATLLSDLDSIASSIEDIASGMYGLIDPGDPDISNGDDMAQELEMQIERLNSLHRAMVTHFESMDPEFNPNAPGMR